MNIAQETKNDDCHKDTELNWPYRENRFTPPQQLISARYRRNSTTGRRRRRRSGWLAGCGDGTFAYMY